MRFICKNTALFHSYGDKEVTPSPKNKTINTMKKLHRMAFDVAENAVHTIIDHEYDLEKRLIVMLHENQGETPNIYESLVKRIFASVHETNGALKNDAINAMRAIQEDLP